MEWTNEIIQSKIKTLEKENRRYDGTAYYLDSSTTLKIKGCTGIKIIEAAEIDITVSKEQGVSDLTALSGVIFPDGMFMDAKFSTLKLVSGVVKVFTQG